MKRFGLVLRLLGRDWRAGELSLLVLAILVAVGTVTAIAVTVDRLARALASESSTFLAADRVISSSNDIPPEFDAQAHALGIETARTMTFTSMVYAGDSSQLVSVKAVSDGYPLRGTIRVADEPFGADRPESGLPAEGEAWLDARIFPALKIAPGDEVTVGVERLKVTRVLATEPDRGGSMFDFGPRLLMRLSDVPATGVVQPGSRIYQRLLLRGADPALATLESALAPTLAPHFRWQSIREANPSIGDALKRAESFLLLGGLMAVLLAGAAVSLGAHRYARRHYDHVAILKTLGATPGQIQWGYAMLLGSLAAIAIPIGLALGVAVHLAIHTTMSALMPLDLPLPGVRPFAVGVLTGLVCLAAFALPPIVVLRGVSPMRVVRRDLGEPDASRALTYGAAAAGSVVLLFWYTGDVRLTAWTLAGIGSVVLAFGALALALLSASRRVGMQAGNRVRLGLAALSRRRFATVAEILVFSVAIMLLLILVLLRTALLEEWRAQLPPHAPNHFVMNIVKDQLAGVQRLLDADTEYGGALFPMIRGRIVRVNGTPSAEWRIRRGNRESVVGDSERNLSFAADLPANNRIVAGKWWTGPGPYLSVEADFAADASIGVGDRLTFDVAGETFDARVANVRSVEWDSMAPNFFILFAPGVLEPYAATWMTSFYLAPEKKRFLNRLLGDYPTITVIEVDEIIAQIQRIIARVTDAVQLVLYLVLAAGCLVLFASIQASRDVRLAEHALLRALGASARLIRGALAVEFAVIGACAGAIAAIGAEATVLVLTREVFKLPATWHPLVWLAGPALGVAIVAGCGLLGTRTLVRSPPISVLREVS